MFFHGKRMIFLDGATGSNLINSGMKPSDCPETWILENESIFIELQKKYIMAGTDILYAPTFTANRIKLEEYGLDNQVDEYNQKLVGLTKRAIEGARVDRNIYIAADMTMTGRQLKPIGNMDFEDLIEVYKEQARSLVKAGVDLFAIETMMSLQEARACVIAIKETCNLPIFATMTFDESGKTLFGSDPVTCALVLEKLGVNAIGANCGFGPDKMANIIRKMAAVSNLPIIAKPNAGVPSLVEDGSTVYNMDADTFAQEMIKIVEVGATIVGGCCGTTDEYIRALVDKCNMLEVKERDPKKLRFLTSERATKIFTLDSPLMVIGERINPTGKKTLQAQIRDNNMEMISDFAREQELAGATFLDINMGMSGIDEEAMMIRAIDEVTQITSLPLVIDSSHINVIERALRYYPGRALINSISLEEGKTLPLLKLAKKYGAMFILLPLSSTGLPKSIEEKISIIDTICDMAIENGLGYEDIIVDGLVNTVAANEKSAIEAIATVQYCRKRGLATVCGLSNISFGLPNRKVVNHTFLTMAMANGLNMAIANPSQKELMDALITSDMLLGKKDMQEVFVNYMTDSIENVAPVTNIEYNNENIEDELRESVIKGKKDKIEEQVRIALGQGKEPKKLVDDVLIGAINGVGDLYQRGKIFLPQLIRSAETMKLAINILEPLMIETSSGDEKATIIIATVKGDIHDIGKNLVVLMLKNYGYRVIDMGKDVLTEDIIDCAIKEKASVIGLSALMTTTMVEMKKVVELAKMRNVNAKIMIGGAVITQDYADEIGADGYSRDASEACDVANRLISEM